MTLLDHFLLTNRLKTKGATSQYTHLQMNGGKFCIPDDKLMHFWRTCALDVASGNRNFVVEMPFVASGVAPSADAPELSMRFAMDLDIDSRRGEVGDREWSVLYRSILATMIEVYGATLRDDEQTIVILNAGVKRRIKDGVDGVKTGRHCIFPHVHVTQRTALRLRELIILRIVETQALSSCEILRETAPHDIVDRSIYMSGTGGYVNGMRMPEMHKAHGCSVCRRMRINRYRTVLEEWRLRGAPEPQPVDVFVRFGDCPKCGGLSYIYEGRPYSVYDVLDWKTGNTRIDLLSKYRSDLVSLYADTAVRLSDTDAACETVVAPILTSMTCDNVSLRHASLNRRNANIGSGGGSGGGGSSGSGQWVVLPRNELCVLLDNFIHTNFMHKSCNDTSIPLFSRPDPHGISQWRRSKDGNAYLATSISSLCLNKASAHPTEPMHNRSQVYFYITKDGSVVQRCHSASTYGNVQCQKFRSAPKWLPSDLCDMLWPTTSASLSSNVNFGVIDSYEAAFGGRVSHAAGADAAAAAADAIAAMYLDYKTQYREFISRRKSNGGAAEVDNSLHVT